VTDSQSPVKPIQGEPDLMEELHHCLVEWETADADSRDVAKYRFLDILYLILNRQEPTMHVTTERALGSSAGS
jgi:hypothetical protein